jgi:hypothetical protein
MIIVEGIHWKESTFLKNLQVVKRKGNKRWISKTGDRYFEWDSLHGEIEVYNRRGKAIAILNSDGTLSQKKIEHGREIDV